jgi:hypothetical protein
MAESPDASATHGKPDDVPPSVELTDDDRYLIDVAKVPVALWPTDTFIRFLFARVPEPERETWILRRALPAAAKFALPAYQLLHIASDRPILLSTGPEPPASWRRRQALHKRIRQHPRVLAALERLRTARQDAKTHGAEDSQVDGLVYVEAYALAREINISGIDAHNLAWYLTKTVMEPLETDPLLQETRKRHPDKFNLADFEAGRLPSSRPTAWVNLSNRPVSYQMMPGAIVVDVTRSSSEDFDEQTWRAIYDAQDRVGHGRPTPGRPVKNAHLYERAAYLRGFEGRSWHETVELLDRDFPGEITDQTSFQRQFYRWQVRRRRRQSTNP